MGLFIFLSIYLLVFGYFLAKKDAESYLMKTTTTTPIITTLIKRWHADGVAIAVLNMVPLCYDHPKLIWQIAVIGILTRLAEFDLVFNSYAKLSITFLGSTAAVDQIFVKIFGANGAVKKSLFFLSALVVFGVLKAILKF